MVDKYKKEGRMYVSFCIYNVKIDKCNLSPINQLIALLFQCPKTKTKEVTTANHKGHKVRQCSESIKTRSKYK